MGTSETGGYDILLEVNPGKIICQMTNSTDGRYKRYNIRILEHGRLRKYNEDEFDIIARALREKNCPYAC